MFSAREGYAGGFWHGMIAGDLERYHMIRKGTVVQEEKKGVLVCFDRLAACAGCNACGRDKKQTTVFVYGQARIGDVVSVEMPDAQVLKASLLSYLVPLLGLLAGLFAASALSGQEDWAMVLGGILGLALSVGLLKLTDKRLGRQRAWQPHITAVNAPDEPNYAAR
ncbi:MAG: SoxR reducing system RseC family protein [Christensenellales bacterium]